MYCHFHFSVSLLILFGAYIVHKGATISAVITAIIIRNGTVLLRSAHFITRDVSGLLLQYLSMLEIGESVVQHDLRPNCAELSISKWSLKI